MLSFSVMGDSISSFKGVVPEDYNVFYPLAESGVVSADEMWWAILAKKVGGAVVRVDAYSGSRVSQTGPRPAWSAFISERRIANITAVKADALIVFGGVNDYGQRDASAEVPTLAMFENAYKTLIKKLRAGLPHTRLYFCVPIHCLNWGMDEKNPSGWTQAMLHESVRRMVGEAQQSDGDIFLIDLSEIDVRGLLIDEVHPNKKGMEAIADYIAPHFR